MEPALTPQPVQEVHSRSIDFAKFKKFFLFNLIGSLVVSALVAVVTVLVGEYSEVSMRVFLTLGMVILHSLMSLIFIWDDERENTFERLAYFINVLFVLIVTSFLTSIFGIWKIIPIDLVWNLYQTYFVIGFASLHGDILSKALSKEKYMDLIIYTNYLFMGLVVLMFQPIIYLDDSVKILGEFYYRLLGAIGIIDGTLSILTMIFYKLYLHKHPAERDLLSTPIAGSETKRKGFSVWVWVLMVYLLFQVISSFLFGLSMRLYR